MYFFVTLCDTLSNSLRRLEGDTCYQIDMWCMIMPHRKRLHQANALYYVHKPSPHKDDLTSKLSRHSYLVRMVNLE